MTIKNNFTIVCYCNLKLSNNTPQPVVVNRPFMIEGHYHHQQSDGERDRQTDTFMAVETTATGV